MLGGNVVSADGDTEVTFPTWWNFRRSESSEYRNLIRFINWNFFM